MARTVITPRRPRVRVTGSVLDVAQTRARVERERHEGMAKIMGVKARCLSGHSVRRKSTQSAPHGWLVEPTTGRGREEGSGVSAVQVRLDGL
jgi:hypothetical protein